MAVAGRVAIVPKGEWSANAAYKRLDAVTYNNTLYFAKKEVPEGTATSNMEYWSKSIVGGVGAIAKPEEAGIVKPDGKSMSVDESGTLSINLDGTTITLDEAKNVIKLADTLKDAINGAFPAANVANNQITTVEGFALDARQANPNLDGTLAKQVADLNGSLKKITLIPEKWVGVDVEGKIFNVNGKAGGIIFYPHMYLKEIHFIANGTPDNSGVIAQAGFCTSDASVPEVYTTGDKRLDYVNYASSGECVLGINGKIDHFYIAGPTDLSITNLFGILY